MSPQPHSAVQAVHDAARVILDHALQAPSDSFWRKWFEKPDERHFADDVRAFVTTLDFLLDVPPAMLNRADVAAVQADVDQVVSRIEAAIESATSSDAGRPLASAVYVIRARYEEFFQRRGMKP